MEVMKELQTKNGKPSSPLAEHCREHGVSPDMSSTGRLHNGGLQASDLKCLKDVESELAKPKRMYSTLVLEDYVIKDLINKSSNAVGQTGGGQDTRRLTISCGLQFSDNELVLLRVFSNTCYWQTCVKGITESFEVNTSLAGSGFV